MTSVVSTLPETAAITTTRHPFTLFFDGECCFCNRWVGRLMRADLGRRTRFGAKQGRTFQQIVQAHPELANIESIVLFVRQRDGSDKALVRSAAVLAAIDGLPHYRISALILHLTPRFLSDLGYRIFSKMRKFIFGTQNVCNVVKPQDRELFLD